MALFYDPAEFDFVEPLEQNWREIYQEYLGISDVLVDWFERELYGEGWKVFGLFNFPQGEPIEENVKRCPLTASLVQRYIRNHGAAGFSVLKPMTRIKAHQGYQGDFARCHLGLRIPGGDCGLRVLEQTRQWEEGKVFVFDDRDEHEAWNLTHQDRVILLVDFVPEK